MIKLCKRFLSVMLISVSVWMMVPPVQAMEESSVVSKNNPLDYVDMLDDIAKTAMDKTDTPGVAIVVVTKDRVVFKNYGMADREKKVPVTDETLFELGSMSKAYTGLGILHLVQNDILTLDEQISNYLPWFSLTYEGENSGQSNHEVPVTVANALYHTTGLPFQSITKIQEGIQDTALYDTVQAVSGSELDFYPGQRFSYATVNYDILGHLIEVLSGDSYEAYIQSNVLEALSLNDTYLFHQDAHQTGRMATGYKRQLLKNRSYDAPIYRGNTPAGYVISSAKDMARWLQVQMGFAEIPEQYQSLIRQSHIGDSTVATQGDFYYGAGWNVNIRGEWIIHGGSNPNFSSLMYMDRDLEYGICVLTNSNTSAADYIVGNFQNAVYGLSSSKLEKDLYQTLDTVFTIVSAVAILMVLCFGFLFIRALADIRSGKRKRQKLKGAKVAGILVALPIMVFYCFCLYYLPNLLLMRLDWKTVVVWGSLTIPYGCFFSAAAGVLFLCYVILTFNFPKNKERNYFALVPLSIMNGLVNALIIFTINESFNRNLEYSKELLVYFIFSLAFSIYTNKLANGRLIIISNEIAYEKRTSMIETILKAPFEAIEEIGQQRIYSGLNNDIGVYQQIPELIVTTASNFITLLFCLFYLLSNSWAAFAASVGVILLNSCISIITSRISKKYWEKNRDIQDIYFGQIADMIYGFKELVLSKLRKSAFWEEIAKYTRLSAELSKQAAIKFLNFGLYNQLMYNLIFGLVVFVFPMIMIGISANSLRESLFMVFYLIGPFGALMAAIPKVAQMRVNLKRLHVLTGELNDAIPQQQGKRIIPVPDSGDSAICYRGVVYEYTAKNDQDEKTVEFTLGPLDLTVRAGEIIYITGGNGSGKSTLGKIITGLYQQHAGTISINGTPCDYNSLNACFSAVYTDFHLFQKLYGVDFATQGDQFEGLLEMMKIKDLIDFDEEGSIRNLNLSAGQKKRLAYIICCLDDKPFILFDEWAAEQDPEFREYFYARLLPELKQQGKGLVVITHDDRFFHMADHLIKLEHGKLMPAGNDAAVPNIGAE